MMKLHGYGLIVMVVGLALVFFVNLSVPAESKITIKKIEESELDAIMLAGDNPVVIAFMASWCSPCIDELPTLNKLYKKFKDQGLKLVGISIDAGGADALQPIVNKLKIDFPVYWYGEKAVFKFNLKAIPLLVFVKQGEVVERLPGSRPEWFLDKKIREFIK
jgi:thiol-disulfide isomerase/thioredoxin